jgi:hypothetical protein
MDMNVATETGMAVALKSLVESDMAHPKWLKLFVT